MGADSAQVLGSLWGRVLVCTLIGSDLECGTSGGFWADKVILLMT